MPQHTHVIVTRWSDHCALNPMERRGAGSVSYQHHALGGGGEAGEWCQGLHPLFWEAVGNEGLEA